MCAVGTEPLASRGCGDPATTGVRLGTHSSWQRGFTGLGQPQDPASLCPCQPHLLLGICPSAPPAQLQEPSPAPSAFSSPMFLPPALHPFFVLPNLPIPNALLGPGCHQLHHLSPPHLHALTLPHSHQTGMKTLLKHHQLGWEKVCSTLVPRPSWALAGGHKRRDVWVRRRHPCDIHPTSPAVFHTINCCRSSAKLGVLPVNTTVKHSRNPPQPPRCGQPHDAGQDLLCILLC